MLDKIVKKSKKIIKKIKNRVITLPKNILIGICIILFMIITIIITNIFNPKIDNTNTKQDNSNITKLFEEINNNYKMKITIQSNETETKYTYSTDGNIELYELNDNNDIGYFKYKNNIYKMDSNSDIVKLDDIPSFIDNPYQNITFIKNVINKGNYETISYYNIKNTLQVSDYINEYNIYYNKNYDSFSTKKMEINIFYKSKIEKIIIDYTYVDNLLNNTNKNLKYTLEFSNYNKNDYSEIISYIEDIIE